MTPLETDLIVVRHGQTEWNASGRIQGHSDVALNEKGLLQAEQAAARLAGETVHAAFSSDLLRATQTAAPIAARLSLDVAADRRLREWSLGALEGLSAEEAKRRHSEALRQLRMLDSGAAMPGGESYLEFQARFLACAEEIARRCRGRTALIVTHGGVKLGLLRLALGVPPHERKMFRVPNCAVSRFRVAFDSDGVARWTLLETDATPA